jgi:hypothetical protein
VLGYDKDLCREAVRAFAKELERSLKHRAKRQLGLGSVGKALAGLVVVVQRTDGALRLNVHLHVLGLDGVYLRRGGELTFRPLPTPTAHEVSDIARRTALRVHKAFVKRGRPSPWDDTDGSSDPEQSDPLSLDEPGLLSCYQAAAQGIAPLRVSRSASVSASARDSPCCAWWREVVPAEVDPKRFAPAPAPGDQPELFEVPTQKRSRWGWLYRHVFRTDVDICSQCGGPMRWVEAATTPDAIGRLLAEHGQAPSLNGLGPRAPPRASAAGTFGQLELPFG